MTRSCADAARGHILPLYAREGKVVDTLFTFAHTSSVSRNRLAILLLALSAIVASIGPLVAVERGDVDGALATLDPAQREAQRERVALQVRNRYAIVTLVLGRPSLLDLATGREVPAAWVTVLANVTTLAGDHWQSTSTAPLVERDGTWYLTRPLFA
jgi:hypothetical protein